MRGKAQSLKDNPKLIRITPAYAGKRAICSDVGAIPRDHPRLCGEKAFYFFQCPFNQGSPPPMRGKAEIQLYNVRKIGITPAYAGKSIHSCHPLSMM